MKNKIKFPVGQLVLTLVLFIQIWFIYIPYRATHDGGWVWQLENLLFSLPNMDKFYFQNKPLFISWLIGGILLFIGICMLFNFLYKKQIERINMQNFREERQRPTSQIEVQD